MAFSKEFFMVILRSCFFNLFIFISLFAKASLVV